MKKRRLLLIGPFPDPKGGVSIHLVRLSRLMANDFILDTIDESPIIKASYFNIRSLNIFKYLAKIIKSDIIHIHSSISVLRYLHFVVGKLFFKKIIVTMHSWSMENKSVAETKRNAFLLRNVDNVITVNDIIPQYFNLKNYLIQPAFIPPFMKDENPLPAELISVIENKRKEGRSILVANAYRLDDYQGVDLYGLDMCIDLVKDFVKNEDESIFLIFIVSSLAKGAEKYAAFQKRIQDEKLESGILLAHLDLSFVKLIESADIVLRPTNTDGDALTIREALFLNKVIISSDVVSRPDGTVLFKTRDPDDLLEKVRLSLHTNSVKENTQNDAEFYQEFYSQLYSELF